MDHDDEEEEEGAEREFEDKEGRENVGEGVDAGRCGELDGEGGGGVLRESWGETGKSRTGERGGGEFDEKDGFNPNGGEKRQVEV